jgi:hypothetical protein
MPEIINEGDQSEGSKIDKRTKEGRETAENASLKAQLAAMEKKIEALSKIALGTPMELDAPTFKEVAVKSYEGNIIVDVDKSEERRDSNNDPELWVRCIIDRGGKEEPVWLSYKTVLYGLETMIGKVAKEEFIDATKVYGRIKSAVVDNYTTLRTGDTVPLKVVMKTPVYTVELPDGKIIKARKVNL